MITFSDSGKHLHDQQKGEFTKLLLVDGVPSNWWAGRWVCCGWTRSEGYGPSGAQTLRGNTGTRRAYVSHPTNVSVTALRQKLSWQLGAKDYHKVTLHNKLHTQIYWEGKLREMIACVQVKSNRELDRRQALYRVSWGLELSRLA